MVFPNNVLLPFKQDKKIIRVSALLMKHKLSKKKIIYHNTTAKDYIRYEMLHFLQFHGMVIF